MTVPEIRWRKSTKSGQEADCVEVGHTLTALRDSKVPDGSRLVVDHRACRALIEWARGS